MDWRLGQFVRAFLALDKRHIQNHLWQEWTLRFLKFLLSSSRASLGIFLEAWFYFLRGVVVGIILMMPFVAIVFFYILVWA